MSCQSVNRHLGAFVDDELPGVERLRVASHLESCGDCAAEVEMLRSVGDLLRASASLVASPPMEGLADGVVTRVRAEQEQSWLAMFQRGVDDWHWAIVGLGSVAATTVVTLVVSLVLSFGPAPARSDSLAAVLNELSARPAEFVVFDDHEDITGMFARLANGGRLPPRVGRTLPLAVFLGPTQQQLVEELSDQFMRDGQVINIGEMNDEERAYTGALLDSLNRIRTRTSSAYLWESTTVSASGL